MERTYNAGVKGRLLPFAASFSVTCLFFINVCNWIFGCGCRSLWAGADAMCNVHLSASRHCPFCSRGVAGYAAIMDKRCEACRRRDARQETKKDVCPMHTVK